MHAGRVDPRRKKRPGQELVPADPGHCWPVSRRVGLVERAILRLCLGCQRFPGFIDRHQPGCGQGQRARILRDVVVECG